MSWQLGDPPLPKPPLTYRVNPSHNPPKVTMHTVQDLDGVNMIRAYADTDTISLTLCAPAGFTEAQIPYPAESFTLDTIDGIRELAALCTALIAAYEEVNE